MSWMVLMTQSIGRAWLLIRRGTADVASQLGRDFLLQKLLEDHGHAIDDDLLHLAFNGLENRSTLLCL